MASECLDSVPPPPVPVSSPPSIGDSRDESDQKEQLFPAGGAVHASSSSSSSSGHNGGVVPAAGGGGNVAGVALMARIAELERTVAARDSEIVTLKRQKRTLENASERGDPPKKLKTASQKKKLFQKWVKNLKTAAGKHKTSNYGCGETIRLKVTEVSHFTPAQFEDMFEAGRIGVKTQPLPNNKPTSVITIISFETYEKVAELFGGQDIVPQNGYKLPVWKGRMFQKSFKVGVWDSYIQNLLVKYHTRDQSLTLEFTVDKNEEGYGYD